jgi:class 3 adenylate cyclase/pimeloyl-ACP methyl ester carboxylesterase
LEGFLNRTIDWRVQPETQYARSGDVHIAYQVVGDGSVDLVHVPGYQHVEMIWEWPATAQIMKRLSMFSRLILFDKRGTGLSDPVPLTTLPTLEEWMDDVRAVMDAVGCERAAIMAFFEGGPMAMLFAATYPERTSALVLVNSYARLARADGYPWGVPSEPLEAALKNSRAFWRTGGGIDWQLPSRANDPEYRSWWARFERASASPGTFAAIARVNAQVDVRHVLPSIQAPTLILHSRDNPWIRVGHGRYLAQNIPGARYVEVDSPDIFYTDPEHYDEIEEFITGFRPVPLRDRVLATVLFTDIVGSTKHAAGVGDARWHELLDSHHAIVRRELATARGREVKTLGDGFLATFDGPARAIRCAHAILDRVRGLGLEVRAGLHTGECELIGEDVGGIAVHIAARVAALAEPGEVLVSSTVKDLVAGSGIRFMERGMHELKGVPEEWHLFAVEH